MSENYYGASDGSILSDVDIQNEMQKGNLFIAPYEPLQLQPSGYNLTPTRLIYSTKRKKLLPVYENDNEVYVMIEKNDTVLVRTRETIIVPAHLSGAFYSKVKVVSLGFGHVSTTLDPHWEGQLLISLNNPTNGKLKFSIEKNVYGKIIYNSFVTVQFMALQIPTQKHSDNLSGRLDILDDTIERNVSIFKKREVQNLKELVNELHKYELKNIDTVLIENLDENEQYQWKHIQEMADEHLYEQQKKAFLQEKHKKYLRYIRNRVNEDANACINIVNHYIENKQKCLPLTYIIFHWLKKYTYEVIGVLSVIILIAVTMIPANAFCDKPWIKTLVTNLDEKRTVLGFIVVYILFPSLREIWTHLWNRIQ